MSTMPIKSQRPSGKQQESSVRLMRVGAAADFDLVELTNPTGLKVQFLPSGALFALRHRETLLNQLVPGPGEDGLFRLLLRWHDAGAVAGSLSLIGPGLAWGSNHTSASWVAEDSS